MATGGTIPTNRTQSVSFYDTTGIIERHKNIYYAPMFTTAGGEVRNRYLSAFNVVCPPSSVYSNISLSSWSPQDRTLVVKGNIDDFRLVTEEGECLNYLIITRNITKGEGQSAVTKTYYYAFFITGVTQSGGSSITITVEPDDFTNVFYLHNKSNTTISYEPFSEMMTNCYVNRQHYNRIKVQEYNLSMSLSHFSSFPSNINVDDEVSVYDDETGNLLFEGVVKYYYVDDINQTMQLTVIIPAITTIPNQLIELSFNGGPFYYATLDDYTNSRIYNIDNANIFYNQKETFKYKYQYRDSKYPLSIDSISNFTKNEIEEIEETDDFEDLSSNLQKKIILSCIAYEVIETKTYEGVAYGYEGTTGNYTNKGRTARGYIKGFRKPNATICSPFLFVPEQFSKYEDSITDYQLGYLFYNFYGPASGVSPIGTERLTTKINEKGMADYILTAFIVNDIGFPLDKISINTIAKTIRFRLNVDYSYTDDDPYFSGFYEDMEYEEDTSKGIFIKVEDNIVTGVQDIGVIHGFTLRNIYSRIYNIKLTEEITPLMLRTTYCEPTLSGEPYSFYSVSCLSFEMVFNKLRYFKELTNYIKLNYVISQNNATKLVIAPSYTIEGKETIYYNEGLTFTLSSFLPIASSSYYSYYYQNMSQMKNQFAVNDYNRRTDLLQHLFISGPNSVGYSAGKGGMIGGGAGAGASALLETGNQVMQMVDEGIDWAQSDKVIEMNQEAMLADMGRKPDNIKQAGSDVYSDLVTGEFKFFLNHYTIDKPSYDSICKLLERTGYQIDRYDNLNAMNRVGWNFIKLNGFDWKPSVNIMVSQEESIRNIFLNGVTLLHNKTYLTSGHNFETILSE